MSSLDLENRLYDLLDQMRNLEVKKAQKEERPYHIHGLCVVLGYDSEKHSSYFNIPGVKIKGVGDDVFENQNIYLYDPEALQALEKGMAEDGAILIDKNGKFLCSGQYILVDLVGIYTRHPEAAATFNSIMEKSKGGTRHLNAIALSAELPDLPIATLKSDYPETRIFKGGRIYRSTVPGEGRYDTPVSYQKVPEF